MANDEHFPLNLRINSYQDEETQDNWEVMDFSQTGPHSFRGSVSLPNQGQQTTLVNNSNVGLRECGISQQNPIPIDYFGPMPRALAPPPCFRPRQESENLSQGQQTTFVNNTNGGVWECGINKQNPIPVDYFGQMPRALPPPPCFRPRSKSENLSQGQQNHSVNPTKDPGEVVDREEIMYISGHPFLAYPSAFSSSPFGGQETCAPSWPQAGKTWTETVVHSTLASELGQIFPGVPDPVAVYNNVVGNLAQWCNSEGRVRSVSAVCIYCAKIYRRHGYINSHISGQHQQRVFSLMQTAVMRSTADNGKSSTASSGLQHSTEK